MDTYYVPGSIQYFVSVAHLILITDLWSGDCYCSRFIDEKTEAQHQTATR